jgi:hypothetical protein
MGLILYILSPKSHGNSPIRWRESHLGVSTVNKPKTVLIAIAVTAGVFSLIGAQNDRVLYVLLIRKVVGSCFIITASYAL